MQAQVHRRAFDADGIIGGDNGLWKDGWYYFNASRAVNFVNFSDWTVTGFDGSDGTIITLTAAGTGATSKQVLLDFWRERDPGSGLHWITGFVAYTAPQPLDMLQLQYPCKGCNLAAKVVQVIAATETTLTLKLDKDLSQVWDKYYAIPDGEGGYLPEPTETNAKLYNYGRESENWFFIQDPHLFFARRKEVEITAAELPPDGIWVLETALIAPPESADPLVPNFVMQGMPAGTEEWQTINENATRLHIRPSYSAYAVKSTLPEGSIVASTLDDLTASYERFRVVYFVETDHSDPLCQIVGFDRCYYSRKDPNNSIGNYGAAKGVGITPAGDHVYCAKRVYETYTYVDDYNISLKQPVPPAPPDGIPDRVITNQHHPTGLDNFPVDSGRCIQYNFCNRYVNSMTLQPPPDFGQYEDPPTERQAPFNVDHTMRFLTELWFAADKRAVQRAVYAFGPMGYIVGRVLHASVLWLVDYYGGTRSPHGFNPEHVPRGNGSWSTRRPTTVTGPNENSTLPHTGGLERGYLWEYDEEEEEWSVDHDRLGVIPENVPGFTTKRDPFDPDATVSSDLLEYIGAQLERDTMSLKRVRGLSGISMALGPEDILIPDVQFDITTEQHRSRSTFQMISGTGIISILPYRQEGKGVNGLGSRVVQGQQSVGGGRYIWTLVNTVKRFSQLDIGDPQTIGDSYNKIYSVMAGGGPVVLPYEPQGLNSFDGDKDTGSRAAGLMPLDVVEVDGRRFIVDYVGPHEGAEAPTWGNRNISIQGVVGGFKELDVGNLPDGTLATPLTLTTVRRISDSKDFPVNTQEARPTPVADEVWFDGDQRLYFAAANHGDAITIEYEDSNDPANNYSTSFTVEQSFTVYSNDSGALDYSEWSNASTKTIFLGATAATVDDDTGNVKTPPPPGTVRVNNNAGKIELTFNINDAPKEWRVVLEFAQEADPPADWWAVGGQYSSFGKKQDIIGVRADVKNGQTYLDTATPVGKTVNFYSSAAVFLPRPDIDVLWTESGTDNWQQVPAEHVQVEAASGHVGIAPAWFAATFPEGVAGRRFCFKVVQIQMVDNRGQVPASLLNKTEATLEQMKWVQTWMLSGMGEWRYDFYIGQVWDWLLDENGCTIAPPRAHPVTKNYDYAPGNSVYVGADAGGAPFGYAVNEGMMHFGADSRWLLPAFSANAPDGVEIVQAFAVVNASGITRSHWRTGMDEPDTTVTDAAYQFIGFTSPDSFETLGPTIPGAAEGERVVDVTEVMQIMHANRANGKYIGFGVVLFPDDVTPIGGEDGLLPKDPPPYWFYPDQPGDPPTLCGGFHAFNESWWTKYEWGSVNLNQIWLNVNYHGKDKVGQPHPRFPSLIDLPPEE